MKKAKYLLQYNLQQALYKYYQIGEKDESSVFGYRLAGEYAGGPISRFVVLEYGRNPSTDYYVLPFIKGNYSAPVSVLDISEPEPKNWNELIPEGAFIVIVRYVTKSALENIQAFRSRLRGVAYFLDDQLSSVMQYPWLSVNYRNKVLRLFVSHQRSLARVCSDVWVSTQYLVEKYQNNSPTLVRAVPEIDCGDRNHPIQIFYHGSSNHWPEMQWLKPIIHEIQTKRKDTHFQIIGNHQVNRLYRDIPRTTVLHPMPWKNYQAYCRSMQLDIGLAPLLDNPFNAARSHSKYFDILRCGAAGIYADKPPYNQFVENGVTGLLVGDHPEQWLEAIEGLADDRNRLEKLQSACRAPIYQHASAEKHFSSRGL